MPDIRFTEFPTSSKRNRLCMSLFWGNHLWKSGRHELEYLCTIRREGYGTGSKTSFPIGNGLFKEGRMVDTFSQKKLATNVSLIANLMEGKTQFSVDEDYFNRISSETVNRLRPFARRRASTFRPFLLLILSRKPCLFFLFLLDGWYVRFMFYKIYLKGQVPNGKV